MTRGYGMKVSRPGFDVNTAAPNELAFSSQYKTLKIHAHGSGTLTEGSLTATIPHNLGYVPLFLVHGTYPTSIVGGDILSSDYAIAPIQDSTGNLFAYADTTNLYIKAQSTYGRPIFYTSSGADMGTSIGASYAPNFISTGNVAGDTATGAVRFNSVTVAQGTTVSSAHLSLYTDAKGAGSGSLKYKVFGIDEDNTSDFGSSPFGRSQTTANYTYQRSLTTGTYFGSEVTDIVNEILARGGWSSGNSMGFFFFDDTSNADVYSEDSYDGVVAEDAFLQITYSSAVADYKYTIFLNQLE